ncbi:MAG: hypothetical protein AAES65_18775 [Candidatus Thiodiazotropha sp. (ex. Lucinoma kazani)]
MSTQLSTPETTIQADPPTLAAPAIAENGDSEFMDDATAALLGPVNTN